MRLTRRLLDLVSSRCARRAAAVATVPGPGPAEEPGPGGPDAAAPLDAERDSLALTAAAHRLEFDILRREIELRLQQRERMMTYFFLFAGTVLASQVIVERFSQVAQNLQRNPITYLMLSFVLLWFPVETIMSFSYMRSIGRYINTVLSPKLTALSESEEGQTRHGRAYRRWQEAHVAPHLRGQLRWEAYLQSDRPYAYPYFGLSVFAMLRISILFAPSVFAGAQYVIIRVHAGLPSLPLLAAEAVLFVAILFIIVAAFVRTIGSH